MSSEMWARGFRVRGQHGGWGGQRRLPCPRAALLSSQETRGGQRAGFPRTPDPASSCSAAPSPPPGAHSQLQPPARKRRCEIGKQFETTLFLVSLSLFSCLFCLKLSQRKSPDTHWTFYLEPLDVSGCSASPEMGGGSLPREGPVAGRVWPAEVLPGGPWGCGWGTHLHDNAGSRRQFRGRSRHCLWESRLDPRERDVDCRWSSSSQDPPLGSVVPDTALH